MIRSVAAMSLLLGFVTTTAVADVQVDRILPEIRFNSVPLADVIDFLRDISGAEIVVDWPTLEAAGIKRNTPVGARLRDVRFRAAVAMILDAASPKEKLVCVNDYGHLRISTLAELTRNLVEETYDVQDLLGADPKAAEHKAEILLALVTRVVEPWTWQDEGGLATAKLAGGKLIVTQRTENQHAIQSLLAGIRALRK